MPTYYPHRKPNLAEKKPYSLSPEKKALQKEKASCYMVIRFNDGNTWSKWSNEYDQKWILNISDAINEMFRIFDKSFRRNTASAAIFDTREHKTIGAHNKIYQFENGTWKIVQDFTW